MGFRSLWVVGSYLFCSVSLYCGYFLGFAVLFCLRVFCGFSIWFFWDVVSVFWLLLSLIERSLDTDIGNSGLAATFGDKHFYRFYMATGFAMPLSLCMSLWVSHIWISSLLLFLFFVRLAVRLIAYYFEFVICYFFSELFEFFECMFSFFLSRCGTFLVVVVWEMMVGVWFQINNEQFGNAS